MTTRPKVQNEEEALEDLLDVFFGVFLRTRRGADEDRFVILTSFTLALTSAVAFFESNLLDDGFFDIDLVNAVLLEGAIMGFRPAPEGLEERFEDRSVGFVPRSDMVQTPQSIHITDQMIFLHTQQVLARWIKRSCPARYLIQEHNAFFPQEGNHHI